MTQTGTYTRLNNRGLITISGQDRFSFLQGLITNDIEKLKTQPSLYACFLTPQGKFMFDFFITEKGKNLLLECEGGARAEALCQKLTFYKLRANIEMSLKKEIEVFSISLNTHDSYPDPRHPEMGYRSLVRPNTGQETPFEDWDMKRIKLTIPDGSRDMIEGKSTLLESNIDKLNGISFEKGCYVGQELTARMHYRGLAKKHLYGITGNNLPPSGDTIRIEDKAIGEMRSSCRNYGLALLKDSEIKLLDKTGLQLLKT